MGAWLSTIHVRCEDRGTVRQAAERVAAEYASIFYLGPVRRGWIALICKIEANGERVLASLAENLMVPIFHCLVLDDDDFRYAFYRDGKIVDRYSSNPEAYGADIPASERDQWLGNPVLYGDLLGSTSRTAECRNLLAQRRPATLADIEALQKGEQRTNEFVFESDRMRRFAKLLGFGAVEIAFDDFEGPERDGLRRRFARVPDDTEARDAKRRESAERRAIFRKLLKEGTLLAEFKQPKIKSSPHLIMMLDWALNPKDSSLIVDWHPTFARGVGTSLKRFAASDYQTLQPLPATAPSGFSKPCFSASGRYLAVAFGHPEMCVSIWEWPDREVSRIQDCQPVTMEFDPAEELLLVANHQYRIAAKVATGEKLTGTSLEPGGNCVSIAPSGKFAAITPGDGAISICELPSFRVIKTIHTQKQKESPGIALPQSLQTELMGELRARLTQRIQALTAEEKSPKNIRDIKVALKMGGVFGEIKETFAKELRKLADEGKIPKTREGMRALFNLDRLSEDRVPERFGKLLFSPDGKWLFSASDRGMKAWRWPDMEGAGENQAPQPVHQCAARKVGEYGGRSDCFALTFDKVNQRLLFAGREGIVEYLDVDTGAIGTLLRPPELLVIVRLALSADLGCLAVQSREFKRNSDRTQELRLWNYPALCGLVGLPVKAGNYC